MIDEITPELVPETTFELAKGDTMLLLTDGAIEQDGHGGMFGFERVHAELAANAHLGPAQVIDALAARVAGHGGSQEDDVTLLALTYVGVVDPAPVS